MTKRYYTEDERVGRVWTRRIIALFALMLAVNVLLVYLAVGSHHGEIEDNVYEKGIAYQEVIEAQKRAQLSNWKPEILIGGGESSNGEKVITVKLLDAAGVPVLGRKLKLKVFFPAKPEFDMELPLVEASAIGAYQIVTSLPNKGLLLTELTDQTQTPILLWKSKVVY